MKRLLLQLLLLIASASVAVAQIPYFAPTVGDNRLYGYTSIKIRPGVNAQESYTTFQYGIGNYFAAGLDLYTAGNSVYNGYLLRAGYTFSNYFKAGMQLTPSFNLANNFRFEYLTAALYLNGNIIDDGSLFWNTNTWYGVNRYDSNTISQYLYLGSNISLPHGQSITPMVGTIYSWKFDQDADLTFGAYWLVNKFNIYLWTNDILKSHPRVVIGIDVTI